MSSEYLNRLFSLSGKTAIVTGGSRGIGAGLAEALASAGADIVLVQRSPTADELKARVEKLGRKLWTYQCDFSDKEAVRGIVRKIVHENGHKIDILVNNAGVQHRQKAEDFADDEWDKIIQVNLSSVFTISRDLAKYWIEHPAEDGERRKIIDIASVLTFVGSAEVPAYTATKGAVGQLTKALSNEWASKGINVNSIAPGYIQTDFTSAIQANEEYSKFVLGRVPMNRWGTPSDLDGAVIYLASRASDFVTGTIQIVDGGYLGR